MPVDAARKAGPELSRGVKVAGVIARSLVILALVVLTARVASPQIEHIWSILETPDDLIRVALGVALCTWCIANIFILPKDEEAYRMWIYLGLAILPLSLLAAFVAW